jgi:hypothetical protein
MSSTVVSTSPPSIGLMLGATAIIFVLAAAFIPGAGELLRAVTVTRRFVGPAIGVVGYVALIVWARHLAGLYDTQSEAAILSTISGGVASVFYTAAILGGLVFGWKNLRTRQW